MGRGWLVGTNKRKAKKKKKKVGLHVGGSLVVKGGQILETKANKRDARVVMR